MEKEYKIDIDPRILELLGPSLYTNIYYVLAELIANAYDADAHNVYIIAESDRIIIEDDGSGMSYGKGVKKYLAIGTETRTDAESSYTKEGRRKMGRKGVGKLAALSVSENVNVTTIQNGDKSGFVLSKHVGKDGILTPIKETEIKFRKITDKGTAIEMVTPKYSLNKTAETIKRNLIRLFPAIDKNFRLHIIVEGKTPLTLDSNHEEMIRHLAGLITLGTEFKSYAKHLKNPAHKKEKSLLDIRPEFVKPIKINDKKGQEKEVNLVIKGWIGVCESTRGAKLDAKDFSDNFVSLFSNKKLGEYNILPNVGKNLLNEVYVSGQLHIDLFEETELPDMALSNRQGYKDDDIRYVEVVNYVRDTLLPEAVALRKRYSDYKNEDKRAAKLAREKEVEDRLEQAYGKYKTETASRIRQKIEGLLGRYPIKASDLDIEGIVESEVLSAIPMLGLKKDADENKKRILISHTFADKCLADVIYKMLIYNDIPKEDIIYTNSENEVSRIPKRTDIFEYLRNFFVDSRSSQKIYVIYVTSNDMSRAWAAVAEVGAGWVTKRNHEIFNIMDHKPQPPLVVTTEYHNSVKEGASIKMNPVEHDKFAVKILDICSELGYATKDKDSNKDELRRHVTIME